MYVDGPYLIITWQRSKTSGYTRTYRHWEDTLEEALRWVADWYDGNDKNDLLDLYEWVHTPVEVLL